MKIPTLFSFITECLVKSGLEVDTYHLSDNSGSGINIYKENDSGRFMIELQFTGDGIRMTGVDVYKIKMQEVEQEKII